VLRSLISLVLALLAACSTGCGSNSSRDLVATPGPPASLTVPDGSSPLAAARRDAAKRLGVSTARVVLASLQAAGWDGCFGVIVTGQPCSQLFVAGEVAIFSAAGKQLRYHIAGSRVVGPVDPAQASDGSPVAADDAPDLAAALSAYAADDFATDNKVDPKAVTVVAVWPDNAPADGALARIRDSAGNEAVYALAPATGIAREFGTGALAQPPPALASVELAMRQQLAQKLGAEVFSISVLSYHSQTWPNGCAGLEQPGVVCAQVVTPGFEARLSDASGKTFVFRGAGDHFGLVLP